MPQSPRPRQAAPSTLHPSALGSSSPHLIHIDPVLLHVGPVVDLPSLHEFHQEHPLGRQLPVDLGDLEKKKARPIREGGGDQCQELDTGSYCFKDGATAREEAGVRIGRLPQLGGLYSRPPSQSFMMMGAASRRLPHGHSPNPLTFYTTHLPPLPPFHLTASQTL